MVILSYDCWEVINLKGAQVSSTQQSFTKE